MKTCEQCGKEFKPNRKDQKHCSVACANDSKRQNVFACKQCGKEYHAKRKDRNTYCSRECAFEYRKVNAIIKVKPRQICLICGKEFDGRKDRKYCSDECLKERDRQKGRQYWKTHKAALVVNEHITKACKECGVIFTTNFMASMREYCSEACARKRFKEDYKKQRKEQLKKAFVKPVYFSSVYKRDKGICQICGKPVDYKKSPEDPMGATIDHVVPLSLGGKHHPDNCQLAHRRCNSIKGVNIEFKIEA